MHHHLPPRKSYGVPFSPREAADSRRWESAGIQSTQGLQCIGAPFTRIGAGTGSYEDGVPGTWIGIAGQTELDVYRHCAIHY